MEIYEKKQNPEYSAGCAAAWAVTVLCSTPSSPEIKQSLLREPVSNRISALDLGIKKFAIKLEFVMNKG